MNALLWAGLAYVGWKLWKPESPAGNGDGQDGPILQLPGSPPAPKIDLGSEPTSAYIVDAAAAAGLPPGTGAGNIGPGITAAEQAALEEWVGFHFGDAASSPITEPGLLAAAGPSLPDGRLWKDVASPAIVGGKESWQQARMDTWPGWASLSMAWAETPALTPAGATVRTARVAYWVPRMRAMADALWGPTAVQTPLGAQP